MPPSRFKLLVPPDTRPRLTVSGRIGPRPDREALGIFDGEYCARSTLPAHLDHLTFTAGVRPRAGFRSSVISQPLSGFYHMREYFVVSRPVLDFLIAALGGELEHAPVHVLAQDGSPAAEPYFAAKITRTIDCIDPAKSYKKDPSNRDLANFIDLKTECELDPILSPEFANSGNGNYISYPNFRVGRVTISEEKVPVGCFLFRPRFWPLQLIIEDIFIPRLREVAGPNNFWLLDLDDVQASAWKMLSESR